VVNTPTPQTPLSQDDELAMMADYAAAMDASMSAGSSTQDMTAAIVSGASSSSGPPPPSEAQPQPHPSPGGLGRPPQGWDSQATEELEHASLSMCVSEASCKKTRGKRPRGSRR